MRFLVSTCLLVLVFGTASELCAERVLMVGKARRVLAVSTLGGLPWALGEEACVISEKRGKACGEIIKVQPTVSFLKLDRDTVFVKAGDAVQRPGRNRRLASVKSASTSKGAVPAMGVGSDLVVNLSGGVNFGTAFFFTMLHLQVALTPKWGWGFQALYSSSAFDNITANGVGGLLTGNYYAAGNFSGFWGQVGAGAVSISATDGSVRQGKAVPIFLGTVGYRYKLLPTLNVAIGAGTQWVGNPQVTLVDVNFTSFKPLFTLDVGYAF